MTKKERFIQILKFTAFSISAGVIQMVSYALLALIFGGWFKWTHITSIVLSVLWNFTFNRKFTFKSAVNVPFAMFLVGCYYLPFILLSTWWCDALVKMGWNDMLVVALNMVINFVTEYLYDTFVVFRKPKNEDAVATNNEESLEDGDSHEEQAE